MKTRINCCLSVAFVVLTLIFFWEIRSLFPRHVSLFAELQRYAIRFAHVKVEWKLLTLTVTSRPKLAHGP
jgi:hypothetical protein